ncbi:hypothetical protein AK812_SmicGene3797 [Symbiodinium microadriaticum]|uniref:RNA methyltransferase bin3 C-terminal domain-containing protein n=1 Tax=Symbiodinium microadriaticum TaxID=2951 RepID=A0A1Q9EY05_SYMMI|nr:hypothetical protein AK812_SmicGene3797 [Symbiodinium microadriaticum]
MSRSSCCYDDVRDRDAVDKGGHRALWIASSTGHVEIVSLLLEFGADTGVADKYHSLLDGANMDAADVYGGTALWTFCRKRHITRAIRDTVASIEIRPEDFAEYLVGLGFEKVDVIDPPDDLPKNFQRQLLIFRRPEEEAADDSAEQSHKRKAERISS